MNSEGALPTLEIAHILFMDIVGYSKLPMDHQRQYLSQLQEMVSRSDEFIRARRKDQLISLPTGDGMALVFFDDAEAPLRCAVQLTDVLRGTPEIQLRMGIHTGPVYRVADINANRNVAGGGINMAQRVMDCADAGHILVSDTVANVLSQVSAWSHCLHDLGETEVKHQVRIRVYNVCDVNVGNPRTPAKFRAPASSDSRTAILTTNRGAFVDATIERVAPVLCEPRLLRWDLRDWILAATAIVGLLAFSRYPVGLAPQSLSRVNADATSAGREAVRVLKQAGWGEARVKYVNSLETGMNDAPPSMLNYSVLRTANNPIADLSILAREPSQFMWIAHVQTEPQGFPFNVIIDSDGKSFALRPDLWTKDYTDAMTKMSGPAGISPESDLPLANMYLSSVLGANASQLGLTEMKESVSTPFYDGGGVSPAGLTVNRYTWANANQDRWGRNEQFRIEILGNRLYSALHEISRSGDKVGLDAQVEGPEHHLLVLFIVFTGLFALVFFGRRSFEQPFPWRAVFWLTVFWSCDWTLDYASNQLDGLDDIVVTVLLGLIGAFLFVFLILFYLRTVECLFEDWWPTKWSTFKSLCKLKLQASSGVPFAFLRGTALAFVALGVCALLRYLAVRYRLAAWVPVQEFSSRLDSRFPAFEVIDLDAVRSFVVAVQLSFLLVIVRKKIKNSLMLTGAGALGWLLTFSHLFPWNPIPFLWFVWVVVFSFALLASYALVRFDFLTLLCFLLGFYITVDNYTLWQMFRTGGNTQYSVVFLFCFATIGLSIYAISKDSIARAWQHTVGVMR